MASYLGWILFTPCVLRLRLAIARRQHAADVGAGPSLREIGMHVAVALALAVLHSAVLVLLSFLLVLRLAPSSHTIFAVALWAYVPLDLLTYLSILVIGYLADADRHAREAALRERVLASEAVDARLSALRARLNPHFLFNVLNTAIVLARAGKPEDTSHLLERLTAMLRYLLDDTRTHVAVGEELDFVRQYLELQRLRSGERLRYSIDCEPRAHSLLVPTLVLQPLVENAVEHGVGSALEGGRVSVTARTSDGVLELIVEDAGRGADARVASSSGIGLASTRERLARLYGSKAFVSVSPREGAGTVARVVLPLA